MKLEIPWKFIQIIQIQHYGSGNWFQTINFPQSTGRRQSSTTDASLRENGLEADREVDEFISSPFRSEIFESI